jgi:hypothetical protein
MIGCPWAPLVATVRAHDKCAHGEWPSLIVCDLVQTSITPARMFCDLFSKNKVKAIVKFISTHAEWAWRTTLAHYVRPSGMSLPS